MATFKVTKTTTVAELKNEFQQQVGGLLRVYNGRSEAADDATLVSLGAKEGVLECRTSRTVGKFEEAFQTELNLKVKVYTKDNWVKVLDGITLATVKDLPNGMTKAKMEEYLAYKRDDEGDSGAQDGVCHKSEAKASDYITYEEAIKLYGSDGDNDRYELSEDGKLLSEISGSFSGALIVPEGVEVVDFDINARFEDMTAIIMPDSVKEVKGWLNGNYCENLQFVRFSHNLKRIPESFLYDWNKDELVLPEGVEVIEREAFKYNHFKSVTLPSSLKFILPEAFYNGKFEEIVIPAGVRAIFSEAFQKCDVKNVVFQSPDTVVFPGAFEDCENIDAEPIYAARQLGNKTFGTDEVTYGDVEQKNWRGEVTGVMREMTYIPSYYCGTLKIEDGTEEYPDLKNFDGITELYIPDSVTGAITIPKNVKSVRLPESLRNLYLNDKTYLEKFNWPSSAKNLRLSNSPIEELIIPEGITEVTISQMAHLKKLVLSSTVSELGIKECPVLEECEIPASVSEFNGSAFSECPSLKVLNIPAGVTTIPYKFASQGYSDEPMHLKEVTIPDTVTTICEYAFSGNVDLKKIVIPASVERIDEKAFADCPSLTDVTIEGNPIIIPGAFENAPGFKGQYTELATSERTPAGLPLLKMYVDQMYFRGSDYDNASDRLDQDGYGEKCIMMESKSGDQDGYPLDKIGYMTQESNASQCLSSFYYSDEDAFQERISNGYLMFAYPETGESVDYGSTVMDNTAAAMALILKPESTEYIKEYNGPEAEVELNVRNSGSEEILHTYRWHIYQKDGKWIADKLS